MTNLMRLLVVISLFLLSLGIEDLILSKANAQEVPFSEPVQLSPKDGYLHVTLSVKQGVIDGTIKNALLFSYKLNHGVASDGNVEGKDLYPGPTLQVNPGESLIIDLENGLFNLTINDFTDPALIPKSRVPSREGTSIPLYPKIMVNTHLNLHVHGLHVSPQGNSDNVLLDVLPGMANRYRYDIPMNHPQGMYWYHSHLHMLTASHTYRGLAALLIIGRSDGNIPIVTQRKLPIRNFAFQYNYVFNRGNSGGSLLNNINWPSLVSTYTAPTKGSLEDGSYEPKLTPINFKDSAPGTTYLTTWFAGPLTSSDSSGIYQFMPSNLQSFASSTMNQSANYNLPEEKRDMLFMANGKYNPVIRAKPGQTEIWVLANVCDFAYVSIGLRETATNTFIPIPVLGQDGNPFEEVQFPGRSGGRFLVMTPASRYVIAVTMPKKGSLRLEMAPFSELYPGASSSIADYLQTPGILYRNNGVSSAVLGMLTIDPSYVSYNDGFFMYPTQTLVSMLPPKSGSATGTTVNFKQGQALNAYTSFVNTTNAKPSIVRELVITGGFNNEYLNKEYANNFIYEFNGNQFPYIPLIQPRLNTIEEWRYINFNGGNQHPIHIHVNDFQVIEVIDPSIPDTQGPSPWGQDTINVPTPDDTGKIPGVVTLRTLFQNYIGAYVTHCHRLNHEDNGLMTIINVIPQVSTFAIGVAASPTSLVHVYAESDSEDVLVKTLTPFAEEGFTGSLSVAMGDIDGDTIWDLIVGAGPGLRSYVKIYSGASGFTTLIHFFQAFEDSSYLGGISVAAGNINGNSRGYDNLVVGSGEGMINEVLVFDFEKRITLSNVDFQAINVPMLASRFNPYSVKYNGGVNVAVGIVDFNSGRPEILVAPASYDAKMGALVRSYLFDLLFPIGTKLPPARERLNLTAPMVAFEFQAFPKDYRGGVAIASGRVAGEEGGYSRVIVSTTTGPGEIRVISMGSRLEGFPKFYLDTPGMSMPYTPGSDDAPKTIMGPHHHEVELEQMAKFSVFKSVRGYTISTSSTAYGAKLLVSGPISPGESKQFKAVVYKMDLGRPSPKAKYVVPKDPKKIFETPLSKKLPRVSLGGA